MIGARSTLVLGSIGIERCIVLRNSVQVGVASRFLVLCANDFMMGCCIFEFRGVGNIIHSIQMRNVGD